MVGARMYWSVLIVVPLIMLVGAALQPFVPAQELLRDPFSVGRDYGRCIEPYTGFLSTLGLFGWAATAGVCVFSAAILRAAHSGATFFMSAGGLSAYILLDDAFLFHEGIVPHFGGDEKLVLVGLALAAGLHAFSFRRTYLEKAPIAAAATAFFLIFSAGIDVVIPQVTTKNILIEDGAKFVGVFMWFGLHAKLAWQAIIALIR